MLLLLGMCNVLDSARCFLVCWGRLLDRRLGYRSLNGLDSLWSRLDHGWRFYRSRLGSHYGFSRSGSGGQFGFLLQAFGFTLAATYFTWVVRGAAVAGQGAGWGGLNHWSWCFDSYGGCNRSRFLGLSWLLGNHGLFDDYRFGHWSWCRGFLGRLDGLFFNHWLGDRFGYRLFGDHWLGLDYHGRLDDHFNLWLLFDYWSRFDRWGCWSFYWGGGFNHWCFRGFFFHGSSRTLGLLVSLGFGAGTDGGAGNGGGDRKTGSQVVAAWLFGIFFRAFDHVAVGITLALATIAATALAAGTTAWTLAIGVVLAFFLQLLFVRQHFFFAGSRGLSLLSAWLAFFAWLAWLALFTRLAGRTFFGNHGGGCGSYRWSSVQWLAQFAHTLFTLAAWLAFFTWGARLAFFTRSTWLALFTSGGWRFLAGFAQFTWLAFFAWGAFFTWSTLFARLALFIATTVAIAALLATVATLFVAGRSLGYRLLDYSWSYWLFLGREQADQGLDQAFEQAWLGDWGWSGDRGRGFGWNRGVGAGRSRLHCGFLADQGAGRGGWLNLLGLGSGSGDLVAGLVGVGIRVVIAQALNFEVWRLEMVVRQNDDTGPGTQFDLGDRVAFFIEQEGGNRNRYLSADFGGAVLQGFFFDQAQDR